MNVPLWHEVVFGLICIAEQNDHISITALWQIDVDSLREVQVDVGYARGSHPEVTTQKQSLANL